MFWSPDRVMCRLVHVTDVSIRIKIRSLLHFKKEKRPGGESRGVFCRMTTV